MLVNKTVDYITTHKLGSCDLTSCKDESANVPLFNGHEKVSSTSDKAKLFAGIFSENPYRDGSGISLSALSSGTSEAAEYPFNSKDSSGGHNQFLISLGCLY